MLSKQEILTELWTNSEIDDIISNITGGHSLREDLKSELFLILSEMNELKLQGAWTNKWINYLIINILMKQWRSNTSPFHKKFRPPHSEIADVELTEDEGVDWNLVEKVLADIEGLPFVERELLKMRYKLGDWNIIDGKLRDLNCKKVTYSYRKIEAKLRVGSITIDHNTVNKHHKKSIEKLRKLNGK